MSALGTIKVPELQGLGAGRSSVRLPDLVSVPLTKRVLEVVDHPAFQRLRRVRQLGATYLVYPGATHTRFEHCLGVYGTTRLYVLSLLQHGEVRSLLTAEDIRTVLMAGLLHDLGHTPFAHTLEAAHGRFENLPRHEDLVEDLIFGRAGRWGGSPALAKVLERAMNVDPDRVVALIRRKPEQLERPVDRLLQSIISSALDADKMDYLWRDSVHLGVPYGRNYDRERLLNALTVDESGEALAISAKGRISAEVFLFCRYTMYSEVYWHHAVRSASAMIQRAWDDIITRTPPDATDLTSRLLAVGDDEFLASLSAEAPPNSRAGHLLAGITGFRRRLYKCVGRWARPKHGLRESSIYQRLVQLEREDVHRFERRLGALISPWGRKVGPADVLVDIPPQDKDRTPDICVVEKSSEGGRANYRMLSEVSGVARGISEDFLLGVKSVQLLVHPDHAELLRERPAELQDAVEQALEEIG